MNTMEAPNTVPRLARNRMGPLQRRLRQRTYSELWPPNLDCIENPGTSHEPPLVSAHVNNYQIPGGEILFDFGSFHKQLETMVAQRHNSISHELRTMASSRLSNSSHEGTLTPTALCSTKKHRSIRRIIDLDVAIITQGVVWLNEHCPCLEVNCLLEPFQSVDSLAVAKALSYLGYVYRSSLNNATSRDRLKGRFKILFKCRFDSTASASSLIHRVADVLQSSSLDSCVDEPIDVWLIVAAESMGMDLMLTTNLQKLLVEHAPAEFKTDVLTMSELHGRISPDQLSAMFDGSCNCCTVPRSKFVAFRKGLEPFMDALRVVAKRCLALAQELRSIENSDSLRQYSVQELQAMKERIRQLLISIEQEPFTVYLESEGDHIVGHLQNDYSDLDSESYRTALTKVVAFYAEVRKVLASVRRGVQRKTSLLDAIVQYKTFVSTADEEVALITQMQSKLKTFLQLPEDVAVIPLFEQSFREIEIDAEAKISMVKAKLHNVPESDCAECLQPDDHALLEARSLTLNRALEACLTNLEEARSMVSDAALCYELLDKACDMAVNHMHFITELERALASLGQRSSSNNDAGCVDQLSAAVDVFMQQAPLVSAAQFQTMLALAEKLRHDSLLCQCQTVQTRCEEAVDMLRGCKQRLQQLGTLFLRSDATSSSSSDTQNSTSQRASNSGCDCKHRLSHGSLAEDTYLASGRTMRSVTNLSYMVEELREQQGDITAGMITEDMTDQVVQCISESTLRRKLAERCKTSRPTHSVSTDTLLRSATESCDLVNGNKDHVSKAVIRRPFRKFLKRSQTCPFDSGPEHALDSERCCSCESLQTIDTASQQTSSSSGRSDCIVHSNLLFNPGFDHDSPPPYQAPPCPPSPSFTHSSSDHSSSLSSIQKCLSLPNNLRPPSLASELLFLPKASSKQQLIVNELLQTELNYVQSLYYVIEHYVPELLRTDLPHVLRGQRHTIFGNVEKILEFHTHQFLPDLKAACFNAEDGNLGQAIAACFLNHKARFHLYALYNKNKPRSDALMADAGNVFFRAKQLLLGDKMDLGSYLLKPVQRMGKYSLLLQQLIKTCATDDADLESLKSAHEMVGFQLRHGNDLLAMDLIRNCDLNLKEQGQLLRQDEFSVFEGKKGGRKCVRRVFLFQHLVLFAKPRRIRNASDGSYQDVYQHKHSLKMDDVGLTEKSADSEVTFELWFRRHTSSAVYRLQAMSTTVRHAWVNDISKLLWEQAFQNREMRLTEVSMGIGTQTCVDLQPSDDCIQDRSIARGFLSKVPRLRNSISLGGVDSWSTNHKRPHSLISITSSSSSSSGQSWLSLQLQHHPLQSPESGISVDLCTLPEANDEP